MFSMFTICIDVRYYSEIRMVSGQPVTVSTEPRGPEMSSAPAAHVLVFPWPLHGHINVMLHLAGVLAGAGVHVTFLHIDHSLRRLLGAAAGATVYSPRPRLRFLSVRDGLPDDHPRAAGDLMEIGRSLRTAGCVAYRALLASLLVPAGSQQAAEEDASGFPPVTSVVADGLLTFAIDIAEELGVPALAFRTASACSFLTYLSVPRLVELGEMPFPPGSDLDEPADRSVVYVSLGSLAVISPEQFSVLLSGLSAAGYPFLLVLRPDMVKASQRADLQEAVTAAGDSSKARVVEWAPQRDVLRYRAVGCFLTHAGWKSTVDWWRPPSRACRRTGLDMKDSCDAAVVESLVMEAMESVEIRAAAQALARQVRRDVGDGGSSATELTRLVRFIRDLATPTGH
ncbi:hypothetical protein GUJ93_ZPchr0013g35608 [Zizania palustris]|uniref:Glycosyltransferase n=1 Tax=Zizania palustris TaxID=103762 RepID=A0A8J5X258_ZIZPA|nr:hypothetical protein GUJ93_ZPchr0013g35608 [Zizania palustris]